KGTRRPQAAKSSLRNMKLLQNLPPHPSGLRPATFPYPLCRCATSPLDKGSRPPGGKLLEGEHLSSAGGRLKKGRLQNPRGQNRNQPLSSSSFCFSSPSMRPSSTSASFRFWLPSFWIFITSSRVEMSCSLVCWRVL